MELNAIILAGAVLTMLVGVACVLVRRGGRLKAADSALAGFVDASGVSWLMFSAMLSVRGLWLLVGGAA